MNAKKAKALRKMAQKIAGERPDHAFKEMGQNYKVIEGKSYRITAPITVAGDTQRGQYKALKNMVKEAYRG